MQDAIAANEQGVGDDLFVGRIVLGGGAGEEIIVPARQHGVEIPLRFEVQPMEAAQLIEEASPNDQYVLVRRSHVGGCP